MIASDGSGPSGPFRSALSNRDIRRVLAGQAIGSASQYLISTALAIYLVRTLGAGSVGLLALRYVPAALLGSAAAIPSSRLGARGALIVLCLGRSVVIGAATVALTAGIAPAVVVALTVLDAALATACVPAVAIVQMSVARSPGELAAASAMTSNTKSAFEVLGGLLAGFLTALFSPAAVFGVSAAVALLGALSAAGLSVPGAQRETRSPRRPARGDWRLIPDRRITPLTAMVAIRASNRAIWLAMSVLAATSFLRMGPAGVGTLITAAGVGSLISIPLGVVLIGRRRLGALLSVTILGMGAPLVLLAVIGSPVAALALIVVWGLCGASSDMAIGALVPRVARGRVGAVVSMNETIKNWMQAAGTALVPVSVAAVGTRSAVALWGAVAVLGAILTRRALGNLDVDVVEHVRILERVRAVRFFKPLRVAELEQLVSALEHRALRAGEVVVSEGDRGARGLFIIDSGTVSVSVRGERVRDLLAGDCFGEIALMHNIQRTATVTGTGDGVLLELDRDDFIGALSDYRVGDLAPPPLWSGTSERSVSLGDALQAMPLLAPLDKHARARLAQLATITRRDPESVLCSAGETADHVFVLLEGTADVLVGDETVGFLRAGQTFGEIGFVHRVPRTATVRAREAVRLAELSAEALATALGRSPELADLFQYG